MTRLILYSPLDDAKLTCASYHDHPGGMSQQEVHDMHQKYGENYIRVTLQPIYQLILDEVGLDRSLFLLLS